MENAFDTLLNILDLKDLKNQMDGKLIELEVDEDTGVWHFNIEFEEPLEIGVFKRFMNRLESLPIVLDACNGVEYKIDYAEVNDTYLLDYYQVVLQQLIEKKPRYHALSGMEVKQEDTTLFVVCPRDSVYVEELLHEVEGLLLVFGFEVDLKVRYCEEAPTITERIEAQSQEAEEKEEQEVQERQQTPSYLSYRDQTVPGIKHKLRDVPNTEDELNEYKSAHNQANFAVEGLIETFEKRAIKKQTTLYTFVLSDGDDAIYVKKFVRDKEEMTFLDQCEENMKMKVRAYAQYDHFNDEVVLIADNIERTNIPVPIETRTDDSETPRVELHLHSKMSTLDGIDAIEAYVKTAKQWNHDAIALTDHDTVQAFPEFEKASKKHGIKPIYGAEISVVDEANTLMASGEADLNLREATYTVFDIETTGLSTNFDKIIEISAVKIKDHQVIDAYNAFINPEQKLSEFTKKLTGIQDSDVANAKKIDTVLPEFKTFFSGTIMVAHNATFDMAHVYENLRRLDLYEGAYPAIDTLQIARQLYGDKLKRFNLKAVARYFNVELQRHHRAEFDTRATADVFLHMLSDFEKNKIHTFNDLKHPEKVIAGHNRYKNARTDHLSVLVKNKQGLKNLYKLISLGNTKYYQKGPALPRKILEKHREGLLIGSGCMNSAFFEIALNRGLDTLKDAVGFYDYVELQPLEDYRHLSQDMENVETRIKATHQRMLEVAKAAHVPVVATSDAHHIDPDGVLYRDIYIQTPIVGGGYHRLSRYDKIPSQYFRTTPEMLEAFSHLDEASREEIVIDNSRLIADKIETFPVFTEQLYAPTDDFLALKGIPSVETKMVDMVKKNAFKLYGNPLPPYVKDRLDKEMKSIIDNKFSGIYYISHLLVKKSLDEGYLVGSRGSVGSSFVATLMDITEVNTLSPHYVCPKCHFTSFKLAPEDKEKYDIKPEEQGLQTVLETVDSGFDLPKMPCPKCDHELKKDGHDIPFETFLGFKGDKVPDIDLNFSGDYQGVVHEYIREIFGKERAFRAGTISTVASKTAFGYVKGYAEKKNLNLRKAEIERRAKVIAGVKRSTGQHPGGIVVVPDYKEIYDVTPVQFPADDTTSNWRTTHFDYHAFEDNLFKLDVLGHDDPTMIRYLMDFVQKDPINFPFRDARDIPLDDSQVYKMLSGTEVLGLKKSDIRSDVASYGVPEMGTQFVRGMLRDSRPKTFADIVKVSGLSHGTDVWLNNAEMLVMGKTQYGEIPFKDVIGCRDDIMVYLIQNGMPSDKAFEISEFIRKGKAQFNPEKWEQYKIIMREYNIPEWYIWSSGQIKYMFPKAHATAYVMMALRIAWFKLYRPIYFYAAYFSKRAQAFDLIAMQGGEFAIEQRMDEIHQKGNKASDPEKKLYTVLEVSLEMVKRGYRFKPVSILESDACDFKISENDALRLPFLALDGLGQKVAESIVKAREEKMFTSREDVKERTLLSSTLFKKLEALDAFGDLPDTSQMNLFDI